MNKLNFKELELDLNTIQCTISGLEVKLTKNEFLLLKFLLDNIDKIFNRKQLVTSVWNSKISLRSVDTTVSRLRNKLGDYGKYIVTRLGFGYGFLTDI
jgi:two-component system, OmpR family, alkaline phosphatase synthesis response regulator PhoP